MLIIASGQAAHRPPVVLPRTMHSVAHALPRGPHFHQGFLSPWLPGLLTLAALPGGLTCPRWKWPGKAMWPVSFLGWCKRVTTCSVASKDRHYTPLSHGSIIHGGQDIETTSVPCDRALDTEDVGQILSGLLLSHRKRRNTAIAATWVALETTTLSERSQPEKAKHRV